MKWAKVVLLHSQKLWSESPCTLLYERGTKGRRRQGVIHTLLFPPIFTIAHLETAEGLLAFLSFSHSIPRGPCSASAGLPKHEYQAVRASSYFHSLLCVSDSLGRTARLSSQSEYPFFLLITLTLCVFWLPVLPAGVSTFCEYSLLDTIMQKLILIIPAT